ncbi:SDR family oxidoreductase [bacterium]|nr:SDR family oxidoreductase [bacterium]
MPCFCSGGSLKRNLSGKTVLITGASGGIGRALAESFAESGACVVLHYNRNRTAAEKILSGMTGGPHSLAGFDVTDPAAVRKGIEEAVGKTGRLDILVNNAGIYELHPLSEKSYAEWCKAWEKTLKTNLLGPAAICHCAAQIMMKQGGGKIINVSSRGAFRGEPHAPAYGASKAGLNSMTQSLALALAPYKIYVYAVAPGWVETEMSAPFLKGPDGDALRRQSPLNRAASPEEVANAVLFLASDGTDFMTGTLLDINGASYLRS